MIPSSPWHERFLLLVVFLAGIGTLGIEMVMPRLMAPFFGTSQPIWAVVIGMTLTYLALGYWLGGRLADRYPNERLLYWLIAWAGLLCARRGLAHVEPPHGFGGQSPVRGGVQGARR